MIPVHAQRYIPSPNYSRIYFFFNMLDSNKRQLDHTDPDPKRPHISAADIDIDALKSQIKSELESVFSAQISALESQVKLLQQKYTQLQATISTPPPLPPREESNGTSAVKATTPVDAESNDKAPVLNRVASSNSETDSKPKHVFGGTLFNIKPILATPTNSVSTNTLNTNKTPKDPTPASSSRPVFGASSSFGSSSAFGAQREVKNVFADLPSQKSVSPAKEATSTSLFGANSKFGNSLKNATQAKSFLDDDAQKEEPVEDGNTSQLYKQVDLAPVKSTTGEENEKSHFNATCKMFELDFEHIADGWKERGLGQLHLNQSTIDKEKVRLVMRSNGLLRVILNARVKKDTEFFRGLEASLAPGKYLRFNSVSEQGKPVQYLLKFLTQVLRDELVGKIDELKEQMK